MRPVYILDSLATIGSNVKFLLQLRRLSRGLSADSHDAIWLTDEARHLKRSLAKVWPDAVAFTTIDSGDVVTRRPPLTLGVLQANSRKLVQVLQAWLSAKAPMLPKVNWPT